MKQEFLEIYQDLVRTSIKRLEKLQALQDDVKKNGGTLGEFMDAVYALKGVQKLAEEERKAYSKFERYLSGVLNSLSSEKTIRTEWVTGTIKTTSHVAIPREGTIEYDDLCAWVGLDPNLPVRISWEKLAEFVARKMEQGLNPPCDLSKMVNMVSISCRGKRELLEGFHE